MMQKSGQFKNMNIYNFNQKLIGETFCCIFSDAKNIIDGFIFVKNNPFKNKSFLYLTDIFEIIDNKIILKKNYRPKKIIESMNCDRNKKAYNLNMIEIGYISEYWFDENTGSVKAVEVAKSIYDDLKNGREIYDDFVFTDVGAVVNI